MDARDTVPTGVFTRASSGLVRQVGTLDTLFYGLMQIGFGFMVFIIAAWHSYPGASMELATVLAALAGIALAIVYALFSAVYPRSGGEYVFLSRTVHPAVGFLISFAMAFWMNLYYGADGAFFALYGLSPFFGALGLQTHSDSLTRLGAFFQQPWGEFLAGSVLILFFGAVLCRGMRLYFVIQRWASWLALASLALTLVALALGASGVYDFRSRFDALAGSGAYAQVVADGAAAGALVGPRFSLGRTLSYLIWPAFALWFSVLSVSFSGEIKNVRRAQLVGMSGATILAGLIMVLVMYLSRQVFGGDFLLSSAAISADRFPLPISPGVNLFAALLPDSTLLVALMGLWPLAALFCVGVVAGIYTTRAILAWGIDGVVPERLAHVSERYHTPTWAILVVVLIAELWLAIYAFTPLIAILSGFLAFSVIFIVVSLAGIAFPFTHPDAFEGSPAAIRVRGLPLLALAGVVALVASVWVYFRMWVDDSFGANTPFSIQVTIAVFVIGLVWFFLARWMRQRQGIDIDRRFREIPIE